MATVVVVAVIASHNNHWQIRVLFLSCHNMNEYMIWWEWKCVSLSELNWWGIWQFGTFPFDVQEIVKIISRYLHMTPIVHADGCGWGGIGQPTDALQTTSYIWQNIFSFAWSRAIAKCHSILEPNPWTVEASLSLDFSLLMLILMTYSSDLFYSQHNGSTHMTHTSMWFHSVVCTIRKEQQTTTTTQI